MKKRILSLLLAAATAVSLLVLPAQAAAPANRFYDLSDPEAVRSVESLRLLGVMDGYSDGNFRPYASLTRAQFCKMAVCALNAEDELGLYRTITVYPDVKPSHWAAGYINMAAKGKNIISGFSDGKFYPDRTVTLGQAATILLRLLGYKDEAIGGIWPDSYLSFAASIGLTDGVDTTQGSAPLTRADAATLFTNLLQANLVPDKEGKGGGSVIEAGGLTAKKDMVLVSCTAKGPDGKETAMLFSDGSIYQMAGDKASNGSLNGCKGVLVLDAQNKVRTFLPNAQGSSRTVVAAKLEANLLTDRSGVKYSLTADTMVYFQGEEQTWAKARVWLNPGATLTLYLGAAGNVEYIFAGGGGSASEAIVVYEKGSSKGLDALTGGVGGYTIYKNGTKASPKDLRVYDVATYSSATNTIRVSDTRITGYYESCEPSPTEPTTITVLGYPFQVLTTAQESLSKFRPGDQITLLLTEDNQVAGAVKPGTSGANDNAIGIVKSVSGSSATVQLLCGIEITGTVSSGSSGGDDSSPDLSQMLDRLVRVGSTGRKSFGLVRLSGGVSGNLDLEKRQLGSTSLAENVTIFRHTSSGLESISLSDLGAGPISNGEISYAHLNWAGQVDVLVLGGTGSGVTYYGRTSLTMTNDDPDNPSYRAEIYYGPNQKVGPFTLLSDIPGGVYVELAPSRDGEGFSVPQLSGLYKLTQLTALKDVPNTAWSGRSAVTVNGRSYSVSPSVTCYNRDTGFWITATQTQSALEIAHAYAQKANLYASADGVIRIIEVGGDFR